MTPAIVSLRNVSADAADYGAGESSARALR